VPMSWEERVWQALSILVAIIAPAITVLVTASHPQEQGNKAAPVRALQLSNDYTLNVMRDLDDLNPELAVLEGQRVHNLAVSSATVTNVGTTPILPTDIHEPISVSIDAPWRILAILPEPIGLKLNWARVSDQRFEAQPALINPGDSVWVRIYLENPTPADNEGKFLLDVKPRWEARIVNMQGFTARPKPDIDSILNGSRASGPINVFLDGREVAFVLAASAALMLSNLYLFLSIGLSRWPNWKVMLVFVSQALVSVSAAESMSHLVFGPTFFFEDVTEGRLLWLNWLVVGVAVLLSMVLATLSWKARRRALHSRLMSSTAT
jgi:hypothetical protein